MHRAVSISDLAILAGRPRLRLGNNLSSIKYRRSNGINNSNCNNKNVQRRYNSSSSTTTKKTDSSPGKTEIDSTTTTKIAGSATSSAGAATSPAAVVRSRGVWEIIKTGPIGRFGDWYTQAQFKRPYVTQVASSFVIYLAGDLSAQLLFPSEVQQTVSESDSEKSGETTTTKTVQAGYDPLRTLRHLIVGIGSSIPSYKWFMFLHHNFNYASKFRSIATKVVVQQIVFTPIFNTYFFSMQSLLAGASIEETFERVKNALPSSIRNSVKLWPAVTAFNFAYIPPHFRSVFGGTIAVGWQTYLSWLNQKAAREVAAAHALAGATAAASPSAELADARVSQAA